MKNIYHRLKVLVDKVRLATGNLITFFRLAHNSSYLPEKSVTYVVIDSFLALLGVNLSTLHTYSSILRKLISLQPTLAFARSLSTRLLSCCVLFSIFSLSSSTSAWCLALSYNKILSFNIKYTFNLSLFVLQWIEATKLLQDVVKLFVLTCVHPSLMNIC